MAQGKIAELPKLGDITLPVHLMNYHNKENPANDFRSGFAYWWAADGNCDVSDDDDNEIGMIGGMMGGHVEMVRYYPNNGKLHEPENYKQSVTAIIDVRDIWAQIETLLESNDVKVQLEGMEEVYEKYQARADKEREIEKMQEEAEKEEAEKEEAEKEEAEKEEAEKEEAEKEEAEKEVVAVSSNGTEYEILENPNGWDLTENMRGRDTDFYYDKGDISISHPNRNLDGLIPINIGCEVKMKKDNGILYTDKKLSHYKPGIVTLNISTWRGISAGAIHYYGKLVFDMPDVHPEGQPTTSTSCWLNLFNGCEIQLTRKLEAWEFEKYPGTYDDYYDEGDNYPGFYSQEEVIERGKQVFADLFSDEWKLEIDKKY